MPNELSHKGQSENDYFIVILIYLSLVTNEAEYFSHVFLAICVSSFEIALFIILYLLLRKGRLLVLKKLNDQNSS